MCFTDAVWRLLEPLRAEDREAFLALAHRRAYARNEVLCHEGDPADSLHLVQKGRFAVRIMTPLGETATIGIRGPGDSFGEMALIDDVPRSADAIVHERCRLLVISKEAMQDLLFIHKDLAYEILWNIVKILSRRLRETNDKMTFMSISSRF